METSITQPGWRRQGDSGWCPCENTALRFLLKIWRIIAASVRAVCRHDSSERYVVDRCIRPVLLLLTLFIRAQNLFDSSLSGQPPPRLALSSTLTPFLCIVASTSLSNTKSDEAEVECFSVLSRGVRRPALWSPVFGLLWP